MVAHAGAAVSTVVAAMITVGMAAIMAAMTVATGVSAAGAALSVRQLR